MKPIDFRNMMFWRLTKLEIQLYFHVKNNLTFIKEKRRHISIVKMKSRIEELKHLIRMWDNRVKKNANKKE